MKIFGFKIILSILFAKCIENTQGLVQINKRQTGNKMIYGFVELQMF